MTGPNDLEAELRRANETIALQAAALSALGGSAEDVRFAISLRRLLRQAGTLTALSDAPGEDRLLEMLVQTAATLTGATAASLLLVDAAAGNLVFRVATGPRAAEVRRFVVPLGQGIAGFVAETGEPLAVSNVQEDARFYRDIGQSIDYIPTSMLCVPVLAGDAVLGVIELLDKAGGQAFGLEDIELVANLAQQAAVAIGQSRDLHDLSALFVDSLRRLAGQAAAAETVKAASEFVRREEQRTAHAQARAIAETVASIAEQGETELELAREWLEAFLRYVQARAALRYQGMTQPGVRSGG